MKTIFANFSRENIFKLKKTEVHRGSRLKVRPDGSTHSFYIKITSRLHGVAYLVSTSYLKHNKEKNVL